MMILRIERIPPYLPQLFTSAHREPSRSIRGLTGP